MLTFIKLGGSLLTDKRVENSFRADVAARLAAEIQAALSARPDLRLLIGHGSGSFGHFVAERYGTVNGVDSPDEWRGFAHVATVAAELNQLVAQALLDAGVPVMRMQPSASAVSRAGVIVRMATEPLQALLDHGVVPLVYGDVALDEVRGGTIISTETVFFYLARHIPADEIMLLGEVDGVYDQAGQVIPSITPQALPQVERALGGSAGTDVTGGMATKVRDMVALVQAEPRLTIRICSGLVPGLLQATLLGSAAPGTRISAD
ncbi:MAG: isopentenyl phosphate kinase family protein [Chloroflexi bacterium]|nr:isopentenyl phosphate kinase family protein [Chloroflexota bacterium]